MAKVCVTGAAGFLGSHLCDALLAEGHEVLGIDNMMGGDEENIPKGMTTVIHDCRFLSTMKAVIEEFCPEVVYHLAAAPHEGLSVFSPQLVTENTYLSTVSMATAACHARVKRFVLTSSMARYGRHEGLPFHESTPCRPVDPYGIAKVAAEQTLLCLGKAHGMEVVIAVPHNIYGPRQKYDDPYRNVAAIMANRMLQGKPPIIYGDGYQRRCFSYVDDCIPPLVKMGFMERLDGGVFNIGPDSEHISIFSLACWLRAIIGFPVQQGFIFLPDRPCEVRDAWPSSNKARAILGYETTVQTYAGLERLVAWIKEKGPKPFVYHLPLEIDSELTPRTWKERLM